MCPNWSSNWWDFTSFMALITEIRSPAEGSTVPNCNGDFNLYCSFRDTSTDALKHFVQDTRVSWPTLSRRKNPADKCNKRWKIATCWRPPGGSSFLGAAVTSTYFPMWVSKQRVGGYNRPWTWTKPCHKLSHYLSYTIKIWKLFLQRKFILKVSLF